MISMVWYNLETWAWYLIGFFVIILLTFFLYQKHLKKFKHTIILFKQTEGGSKDIAIQDKYRYTKNDRGVEGIQLKRLYSTPFQGFGGLFLSMPPPESKNVLGGGTEFTQGTLISKDEIVWIDTKITEEMIKKKDIKFEPFSTMERSLIIAEHDRRELRRRKTWMDLLAQNAAAIEFIIFMILIFIFWGKIMEPAERFSASNSATMALVNENTKQQIELQRTITAQIQALGIVLPNNAIPPQNIKPVPPDSGGNTN